jgi:hypothetical protein
MGTVAPVIVLIHSPNLGPGSWPPCRAAYLVFSEAYRRTAPAHEPSGWL